MNVPSRRAKPVTCPHCGADLNRIAELWADWCRAMGRPVTPWPVVLDTRPPELPPAPSPRPRSRNRRRNRRP